MGLILQEVDSSDVIDRFRSQYRDIVLSYFQSDPDRRVEKFVTEAFQANLAVSDLIGIHIEVIDALEKQLKVEGRNADILLDYRITLIDVISHLCERYRRCLTD
jgi:circadian clock protein KaiA